MTAEPSDHALLLAWREGNEAAGRRLFERHYDGIARFFRNKAPDDTEDLVQRTFLACLEGMERFRGDSSLRTFLFGIAHNLLLQRYQRRAGAEPLDTSSVSLHDLSPSPSGRVAAHEEQRLMLEALRRVPYDYQVVLELHYWEDCAAHEIAQIVGIPVGTAKTRLRRGKQLVRAELEALASSAEVLESTLAGLDGWAAGLRAELSR